MAYIYFSNLHGTTKALYVDKLEYLHGGTHNNVLVVLQSSIGEFLNGLRRSNH